MSNLENVREWLREYVPVLVILAVMYVTSGLLGLAGVTPVEVLGLIALVCVGLLGFWGLVEYVGRALEPAAPLDWDVTATAVTLRELGGEEREVGVRYDELTRVLIETTSGGPFVEDFYYVLETADCCLRIPLEVACAEGLADYLFELPGFDHFAVIEASGCVEDRVFVVWEAASQEL